MRKSIRFLRNGHVEELVDFRPGEMLLDHLRLREGAVGTKEGCSEGDCGACTVAIGRRRNGRMVYQPVNACIQPLGAIDGAEVVTVEDIAAADGSLHPVQAAMVERHASQCGYCTPGFVMSLFTLYHAAGGPTDRETVNDWIAGNLCRCTGYRPIVAAGVQACAGPREDRFVLAARQTEQTLTRLTDTEDVLVGGKDTFFSAPASLTSLAAIYERNPDATIVAGCTDVGLWINKQLRDIKKVIHLGRVAELSHVEETPEALLVGATATFADVEPYADELDPDLGELFRRIGAKQVRASGTVGGNIANGSPIGDTPPALIALGATIELRKGSLSRTLPLEEFYIEYGKQNRQPGELLTGILIPKLKKGELFRCFKVSKRFDQDISAVMGAFRFTVNNGTIGDARIAYGGMAGTPKRAREAETALIGTRLGDASKWANAFGALKRDFAPIGDHRASARYRTETAQALLGKALIETAGTATNRTRLIGLRERSGHVAG